MGLLKSPNPDDPLEAEIGAMMTSDKAKFEKTAKEWVTKYAS